MKSSVKDYAVELVPAHMESFNESGQHFKEPASNKFSVTVPVPNRIIDFVGESSCADICGHESLFKTPILPRQKKKKKISQQHLAKGRTSCLQMIWPAASIVRCFPLSKIPCVNMCGIRKKVQLFKALAEYVQAFNISVLLYNYHVAMVMLVQSNICL